MDNGLVYVMAANLVVWLGIALYLFRLDQKIRKLENEKGE